MVELTYDQIEEDKYYIHNNNKICIVNKHLTEQCFDNGTTKYSQTIIYYYLDNPITHITCPFELVKIFDIGEAQSPPPIKGLLPKMEVYNKHLPTIICSEYGKIEKVVIPDNVHTPHILSIDIGDGRMVDIPTYNEIIIDKFYKTPTKETTLEFLKISEIRGLQGSIEEQISKILQHFPDEIISIKN